MERGTKKPEFAKGEKINRDIVAETDELEREAEDEGDRDTEEPGGNKDQHDKRAHGGRMHHGKPKRARGGHLDAAKEHLHKLPDGKVKEHHPHHHGRKAGGKVPGHHTMHRPDKRARGGATSDVNPFTAAGKMTEAPYGGETATPNGGGMGPDKSPYHGGGHRRPG